MNTMWVLLDRWTGILRKGHLRQVPAAMLPSVWSTRRLLLLPAVSFSVLAGLLVAVGVATDGGGHNGGILIGVLPGLVANIWLQSRWLGTLQGSSSLVYASVGFQRRRALWIVPNDGLLESG